MFWQYIHAYMIHAIISSLFNSFMKVEIHLRGLLITRASKEVRMVGKHAWLSSTVCMKKYMYFVLES